MFERLTLWQTMKERGIDVTMDVKPSTIAHLRQQGKEIYVIAGWRNYMPFFVHRARRGRARSRRSPASGSA